MSGDLPISPLAPAQFPELPGVGGVRMATAATAMKYQGRDDLLVCEVAEGTTVAGTFTQSKTRSAPVDWCQKSMVGGEARGQIGRAHV